MALAATELDTRLECLQAVADSLPAIIAYWDHNERCRFANQACSNWLRREPESLNGAAMQDVLGDELYALNKAYVDGVLRGEPQSFQRGLRDASGVLRDTQISYVPDLQNGTVQGFFVLINDVTSIKRAEAAAQESRDQLQALLTAVPEYIFSLDRTGKIMFVNRTMVTPIESMLGESIQQFFPHEYRDLTTRAISAAFTNGQPSTFESVATLGDVKRWFLCQFVPVKREGETTSVLLLSRDVTERRQMEMQLLATERLAAVGTLAAGVAHEINTPVQFVSDSVEFLRESSAELFTVLDKLLALHRANEDPLLRSKLATDAETCIEQSDLEYLVENIPRAIDRSLDGLKRVAEIVRSLKAFSHLDQKEMTDAQLDHVIDTALTLAANEYKYVAEIVRDYAELPTVRCHVGGISQVILNILINAAHAIGEKIKDKPELGRITISTRDEGDNVLIRISDTGAGVPEHIRPKIFAPFFTTKPVGKGTGQGLAISWTIITQDHHGELWFESEEGSGTTFHIRIPKNLEHLSAEPPAPIISDFTSRHASTPSLPLSEIA